MRKFLIISTIYACFSVSADETQKYLGVKEVLEKTRIQEFGSFVASVKKNLNPDPTNPYTPYNLLSPRDKSFYKSFDLVEYFSGIQKQLMKNFSVNELSKVAAFYENPFNTKILTHLNSDALLVNAYKELGEAKSVKLTKAKAQLLQNVLNLHKLNQLIIDQKNELSKELYRKKELLAILETGSSTEVGKEVVHLEDIYKKFNYYILKFLGSKFLDYRESELKEVSRVMTDEAVQRAAQLIVSYHYYFIKEAQTKFDRTYVPDKNINLESEGDYIH